MTAGRNQVVTNKSMQHRGLRNVMGMLFALVSLLVGPANAGDRQSDAPTENRADVGDFHVEGVAEWFDQKFRDVDLAAYRREEFRIAYQLCNCSDQPLPHYPYVMVFFITPKGDLVGRPERRGLETVIIPLAERHGERYCELHSDENCYGTFAHACEFSDHRFGAQLAPYFPYCKPEAPVSTPEQSHQ